MTASNGSDDKKPGSGGKEQRPYATLDLTAKELPSGNETAKKPANEEKSGPAADDRPHLEGRSEDARADLPQPPGSQELISVATHVGAGFFGAILALIFGYFIFGGSEPPAFSPEEAQALRAQIGNAESKVSALEQALGKADEKLRQLQAASSSTQRLEQEFAGLSKRVANVETRPSGGATAESVEQSVGPLNERLARMEERVESISKAQGAMQTDGKATALALALYNLRRAANEGKPFTTELKSVADMSPVPLDLTVLQARGDQGVQSLDQLKSSFDTAANAALEAENRPASDSIASELWSKAKSFVRIRRKGDVPGDTTRAVLARTEHQLEAEDLPGALSEAEQLQGAAADTMTPWIKQLKARIAAEAALAKVEAELLTALGGEETGKRGG